MKRQLIAGIIGIIGGLTGLSAPLTSQAITNASSEVTTRTATVPLTPKPYYLVGTGQGYQLTDQDQHVQLTATHNLKASQKTTWMVTAQTDVMAAGRTTRYYQATNAKDGVQTWIAADQLAPGRHYQADVIKAKQAKSYTKAKQGRLFQMTGTATAMRLVKGRPLSAKQTYHATKQRYFYRHGTKYLYFYVTTKKGVKGWIWHRYLKAGTYYDVVKQQAAIKKKLQTYLNGVTKHRTTAVAFYNLTPKKGSPAAKAQHAAVYRTGKLAVNAHGNQVTVSASTYKLYIAAYLMHLKQQHQFSWTKANTAGIQRMIVQSANDYPVSILRRYGRTNINHWLASQGYYGGVFSANHDSVTTANSLMRVLRDLATGKRAFKNSADRARILKLMGRQIYRQGIPTGAARADAGTTVQDKVGFLADYGQNYNGDAGIVTLPNGQRYILVVLTWRRYGGNSASFVDFPKIAKITKRVQQIVY